MARLAKGVGEREGLLPHGDVDTDNSPMKVGAHATAALRAAVDENDVADLSADLTGRLRVITAGDVAHDDADSGEPVLVGGHANASLPTAVGEDDRVRASFDLQGQLRVIATGSTGGTSAVDDSVFTGGSTSLTPMGALFDTTPPTITDGNIGAPLMTSGRILRTEVEQATAANLNAQVVGDVAVGDANSGKPVLMGARATAALQTAVDEEDRAQLSTDLFGQLRTITSGKGAHGIGGTGLNPIKVSGIATVALRSAVDEDDNADLSTDLNSRLRVLAFGDVAHDAPEGGNPLSTGFNAAEFAADPPQISLDDDRVRGIATPQGIQYVLGGHPNIISREYMTTAVSTGDAIIDAVPAGSHIVITECELLTDGAGSTFPQVRVGFGTTAPPTEPSTGASVDGMVISHPGVPGGSGVVAGTGDGLVAIGGDGLELMIANDVPTGGKIVVMVKYWLSTL